MKKLKDQITLKLPVYGTTSRSLTIDFISKLIILPEVELKVTFKDDYIMITGNRERMVEGINGVINEAGKILRHKIEGLRDFPVHRNDYKMLSKLLGENVGKGSKFADTVSRILIRSKLSFEEMLEWSKLEVKERKSELQIIYGSSKELPLPQAILTERFESSYMFMHGIGGKSIKMRGTRPWILLLLSGFALSYAGLLDDTIHYIHVPEEFIRRETNIKNVSILVDKILPLISMLNIPLTPRTAYLLYVSATIALEEQRDTNLLEVLMNMREIPFEIERIRFKVNAYTLIEKFVTDIQKILSVIRKFNKQTVLWLQKYSRRALYARLRLQDYSIYANLTSKLYNTFIGTEDPINTLYYALRVVMEKEIRELEAKGSIREAREISFSSRHAIKDMLKNLKK